MATSRDLLDVLKAELRTRGITYAALAAELGMSESNVKRMFSQADMPLTRVDSILRCLNLDMADLAHQLIDAQPLRTELSAEQERAIVKDPKLLLMAICCLSQWTFEQITSTYVLTDAEVVRYLVQLDRLGIIELRAQNRYRLKLDKTFRWRPHGPAMQYFRSHVVGEYFGGGFDGEGELLMVVHGSAGPTLAAGFAERLARVAQDFAHQHLADQRLPAAQRRPYTLLVGVRSWWFSAFNELMRPGAASR